MLALNLEKYPSAVVITASVGKPTLRRAVESVLSQSFSDVVSLVVVDGPQFHEATFEALGDLVEHDRVQVLSLSQNTVANGFVCHRIYGAMPLLVNQDYVFFLDDDNWYDEGHVAALVGLCERESLPWAYSLRKIISDDGSLLCNDNCESLGRWPVWYNQKIHHVDTNCYCFKREVAVALASRWHRSRLINGRIQPSADTEICPHLIEHHPRYGFVAVHSVNYLLGSWGLSPKPEFFLEGNAVMKKRHGTTLPWEGQGLGS